MKQKKSKKQICTCGHRIDEHVGNGQLEECMHDGCNCEYYKKEEF
jgi:hypothetical protein